MSRKWHEMLWHSQSVDPNPTGKEWDILDQHSLPPSWNHKIREYIWKNGVRPTSRAFSRDFSAKEPNNFEFTLAVFHFPRSTPLSAKDHHVNQSKQLNTIGSMPKFALLLLLHIQKHKIWDMIKKRSQEEEVQNFFSSWKLKLYLLCLSCISLL